MAFSSLADELANAFDDHPNGAGGVVPQSLAAEFGLDFEPEGEGEGGGVDDGEFDHELAGQLDRPAPRHHTHATRGSPSTRSSLSGSVLASSPGNAHEHRLHDNDLELALEGDYSFTASHGDDLEAELGRWPHNDGGEAPGSEDDGDGFLPSAESGLISAARQATPARASLSPLANGARASPPPGMSPRREQVEAEQDPLVVLSETLAVTGKFLTSLKRLDELSSEGGGWSPVGKRGVPVAVGPVGRAVGGGVDVLLQAHLAKLQESDRVREEQLRELGVIGREMATLRWGEGLDSEAPSGGLEVFEVLVEEDKDEWKGGWTGDARRGAEYDVTAEEGKTEAAVEMVIDGDRQLEDDEEIDPLDAMLEESDPFSAPLDVSRPSRASHPTDTDSPPSQPGDPTLPSLTDSLLSASSSLHSSLRHLSDTLHTSSSMSTWLARQVRGIRAAAEGFREREDQEEEARKAVEEWEGRKVREGLAGGGGGVEEGLRRECEEFERRLEQWGREMEKIRRGVVM